MAWEWVAPTVTGVVGVVGTTGAVVVARLGRESTIEAARLGAQTQRQIAQDDRRAAAIADLLRAMSDVRNRYVDALYGDPPPTEYMTRVIEQFHLATQIVEVYSDDALTAAVSSFNDAGKAGIDPLLTEAPGATEAFDEIEAAYKAVVVEARRILEVGSPVAGT